MYGLKERPIFDATIAVTPNGGVGDEAGKPLEEEYLPLKSIARKSY
ncbi:hypothetical protein [Bradyrhizobium sacchari]|nr:hypothetical protein [Bradyrhizobium sacchari]